MKNWVSFYVWVYQYLCVFGIYRVAGCPVGGILNCCITAGLLPVREWFGVIIWLCYNKKKHIKINGHFDCVMQLGGFINSPPISLNGVRVCVCESLWFNWILSCCVMLMLSACNFPFHLWYVCEINKINKQTKRNERERKITKCRFNCTSVLSKLNRISH